MKTKELKDTLKETAQDVKDKISLAWRMSFDEEAEMLQMQFLNQLNEAGDLKFKDRVCCYNCAFYSVGHCAFHDTPTSAGAVCDDFEPSSKG